MRSRCARIRDTEESQRFSACDSLKTGCLSYFFCMPQHPDISTALVFILAFYGRARWTMDPCRPSTLRLFFHLSQSGRAAGARSDYPCVEGRRCYVSHKHVKSTRSTSRSRPVPTAATPPLRFASTTGARRPREERPPAPAE